MSQAIPFPRRAAARETLPFNAEAILGALPAATLVIDNVSIIRYANMSAEQLFQASASILIASASLRRGGLAAGVAFSLLSAIG